MNCGSETMWKDNSESDQEWKRWQIHALGLGTKRLVSTNANMEEAKYGKTLHENLLSHPKICMKCEDPMTKAHGNFEIRQICDRT